MTILVVDDSKAIRFKLRSILEALGHQVVAEAANGVEALSLFDTHKPDLVTLDVVMPEMDGLSTLAELMKRNPAAKVVMVTSAASVSNMMQARSQGATSFLIKPFAKERVAEVIEQVKLSMPKAA